jgi:uncharacterized protein (UPF0276 family)
MKDLFGIGWRSELAVGILANLDRIDLVEVIADDLFDARTAARRAINTLAAQIPVTLHGVSLGLASSVPVDTRRLEKFARLIDEIAPISWSEHLAFVRGGGIEIGHLAAPPRTRATIEGALANLARARAVAGSSPLVENVATLIDPPGSCLDEASWVGEIIGNSASDLLLDLHNLYANSVNFGFDARAFIQQLPGERVAAIHLAGGRWVSANGSRRVLDDHLHDIPDPVYELLTAVGARVHRPVQVILERDGNYPSIDALLAELDRARAALAIGRAQLRHTSRMEVSA